MANRNHQDRQRHTFMDNLYAIYKYNLITIGTD